MYRITKFTGKKKEKRKQNENENSYRGDKLIAILCALFYT